MNTNSISSMAALSSPLTPQTTPPTTSGTSTQQNANLGTQSVFLQLLVAQLKNQDPSQPTDGTAFVTELAQFTTLQEDTESATDLDKIVASLTTTAPPTTPAATSAATGLATAAALNGLTNTTATPYTSPTGF